jgi:HAMP domain-containing protein
MLPEIIQGIDRIGLANVLVAIGSLFLLAMLYRFWRQATRQQSEMVDLLRSQVADLTDRVRHLEESRLTAERTRADRLVSVLERLARLWGGRACLAGAPPPTEETDSFLRESHA